MIDAKKHSSVAAGEAPKRGALADGLLSVNDIVPVSNATERAQLVAALSTSSAPVGASKPLAVSRADARALHQVEITRDGTVFTPLSGVLDFASKSDADAWAAANPSLLSAGDRCTASGADFRWDGAAWRPTVRIAGFQAGAAPGAQPNIIQQAGTLVANIDGSGGGMNVGFPTKFPNGVITVVVVNGDAQLTDRVRGPVNVTLDGFGVQWENVSGGGGQRRANWVAFGW